LVGSYESFFFTTQGARTRKSRRPGRAKSHNFHSREEKTHFQLGRFLQRVKTKTKAKWHVSSFLQQNDIINEEPSPRNQYLFNGDFVTWPGEVKWVFCFFIFQSDDSPRGSFFLTYSFSL